VNTGVIAEPLRRKGRRAIGEEYLDTRRTKGGSLKTKNLEGGREVQRYEAVYRRKKGALKKSQLLYV